MSHRVGALLLPVPPPAFGPTLPNDSGVAPILDPALDILGQFFRALLEHHCGEAWANIAPGEPVVRVLSIGHDPEEFDFSDQMTPLLALWREGDGQPTRLDDSNGQSQTTVNVMWVAAPADEQKLAARSPFFNAFTKVMLLAFANERDPAWIKAGEEDNVIARFYGSYVWGHAGIDGWNYGGTRRVPLVAQTGDESQRFPSYLATWTILESSLNDPEAWGSTIDGVRVGTTDTQIQFDLKSDSEDDALTLQSALIPEET